MPAAAGKAGQYIECGGEITFPARSVAVASARSRVAMAALLLLVSLLLLASLLTLTALFEGGRQTRPSVCLVVKP